MTNAPIERRRKLQRRRLDINEERALRDPIKYLSERRVVVFNKADAEALVREEYALARERLGVK